MYILVVFLKNVFLFLYFTYYCMVSRGDDLTTFIVPKVMKIQSLNLPDPQGPVQACSGTTLPLHLPLLTVAYYSFIVILMLWCEISQKTQTGIIMMYHEFLFTCSQSLHVTWFMDCLIWNMYCFVKYVHIVVVEVLFWLFSKTNGWIL
jgi:hypothetical protein